MACGGGGTSGNAVASLTTARSANLSFSACSAPLGGLCVELASQPHAPAPQGYTRAHKCLTLGAFPNRSSSDSVRASTGQPSSALVLELAEAEAIVAVYPTWWYGLPAMLKGYFDRVWAPGIAFDIGADVVFQTDRLDNIRKLGVVTTYGSPWWLIRLCMGDPERKLWGRAIRKLCSKGCTLDWHAHYNMDSSPPERLEHFRKRTENAFARW